MKQVCIVTGSRADYGLLRWVVEGVRTSPRLGLQLIATGMHLSPEFGNTVRVIEDNRFHIDKKIEMLLSSDTSVGVTKSLGLGVIGFADAFEELKPDLVLLLGDRYEIFAAATAAMIARIPIAHLHGGETTEGAFDEAIRHSITKMSHLHFVAAEEYRKRVIQLGEQPERVFNVGGLGIDSILRLDLLTREQLEAALCFRLLQRNLLVTFHPVTLECNTSESQMGELLAALSDLGKDVGLIFTMPNSDTESRILFDQIAEFCVQHSNAKAYTSLGQLRYLSCIRHFDGVVGNSSSGLLEVPTFKKGTLNIGDRQRGRLKAKSIIDCQPTRRDILRGLRELLSGEFQAALYSINNPHGDGGASERIVQIIEHTDVSTLLKKRFYNLNEVGV